MTRLMTALGLATLVASTAPGAAGAQTTQKITVTPSKGLTNGQTVSVTGKYYTPNETVFILECTPAVATGGGEAACDTSNIVTATTTAKGKIPATPFTVVTGPVGNGLCGPSKEYKKCDIIAANAAGTDAALKGIVFAVP